MPKPNWRTVSTLAITTALFSNTGVFAQEVAEEEEARRLDPITVTAQKRSQSVQDVPITINALDSDDLTERGIVDAGDLVNQFPGISASTTNKTTTNFNIRGISTNQFQGNVNRSIGVYIDDVTQNHPFTGIYGVYDTERVEILRGPQNTLNGRNTTGGAINFVSVKPEIGAGLNGYGSIQYGRFDQVNLEGAFGIDNGSNLAFRAAGQIQLRDGPFTNIAPGREGEELGETEKYSGRLQLLYTPTPNTDINAQFRFGIDRGTLIGNLANGFIDPSADLSPTGPAATAPNDAVPLPLCDEIVTAGSFSSGNPSPCLTIFGDTGSANFREVANVSSAQSDADIFGGTIRIDHDFGFATLTSITAYDSVEVQFADETVGTAGLQFIPFQDSSIESIQQEIRLVSRDDQSLRWIVGGYVFREDLEQGIIVRQDQNPLNPNPGFLAGLQITPFNIIDQVDRDLSLFGQLDFDLTEQLTVTGGIRYTNNEKNADSFFGVALTPVNDFVGFGPNTGINLDGIPLETFIGIDFLENQLAFLEGIGQLSGPGMGPPPFINDNFSEEPFFGVPPTGEPLRQNVNEVTGDVSIKYDINSDTNVFFRYARGFKSGAFDTRALASLGGSGANVPVGPETLNAYEIGLKSQPFENVQFNASGFFYDQEGLQVFSVGPLGPQFLNLPSSRAAGIEFDAIWAPTDTTQINIAGSWLDTEIRDDGGLANVDEGHPLENAPEFSFSINGSQDFYIANGRLNLIGSFRWIDEQFDSLFFNDDFLTRKPEQTYIDLTATYFFGEDDRFAASVFGRNLTGEEFCGQIASNTGPIEAAGGLDAAINGGTISADNPLGQTNSCQPGNEGTPLWGIGLRASF